VKVVLLSKKTRKNSGNLEIKPDITTKEIAEAVFGRPVKYKTKECSSTLRILASLERQD
jgi:hypothetical protein